MGLLLSGGLDSSLLAAYATRVVRQPLRTLCMGFADAPLDERIFARQVAEHLGSEHHELFCTRADVLAAWHKHMLYYDDLFWDTGFLSSMLLYRKCRDLGLKVMLVGEGADELFAGYTNFRRSLTAPLRWMPGLFRYCQYRYRSGQQWGQGQLAFDALQ
ncbi:MAG TPA: asparagine synthase C-terminal domain-containing protein, partial [Gemmatales bacterium]|nr:asparagine synthase C-terminal domain-containing protein [Gemmatales bacterium]